MVKIIVPSSRLAICHVQFVAVSASWVTGVYHEDVFSIYICEAKLYTQMVERRTDTTGDLFPVDFDFLPSTATNWRWLETRSSNATWYLQSLFKTPQKISRPRQFAMGLVGLGLSLDRSGWVRSWTMDPPTTLPVAIIYSAALPLAARFLGFFMKSKATAYQISVKSHNPRLNYCDNHFQCGRARPSPYILSEMDYNHFVASDDT